MHSTNVQQLVRKKRSKTKLALLVKQGQRRSDPMLTDINANRLQEVIDRHLGMADIAMLEKKLNGKPSAALRGVCMNLLDRRLDAKTTTRNTIYLLDLLGKNVLYPDGSPNYTRACHLIGTLETDIMSASDEERNSIVQTLLMRSHPQEHSLQQPIAE